MRRGDKIVFYAQADLGKHEVGGPNQGAFVESCLNAGSPRKRKLTGLMWCVGAVNKWVLSAHDNKLPWPWTLSCDTLRGLITRAGGYLPVGEDPRPGDVVFFDWDWDQEADHVAIVQSFYAGRLVTIGGNENDEVRRQERALRRVMGFGRLPSFDEELP